ncbi:MAG: hypothetical protein WBG92_09315 [Thiohalocapsa sp.]
MKQTIIVSLVLFIAVSGDAVAGCVAEGYPYVRQSRENNVRNLLRNKSVDATAPDGENWKEDHCNTAVGSAGNLYKVGDGTAVDPRVLEGTWQAVDINGAAANGWRVRYIYAGGLTYTWKVYRNTTGATGGNALGVGICWEDESGNTIAASPTTTAITGSCP